MSGIGTVEPPPASDLFRWSRERFEELFRIGFFDQNRRLELLDGYILNKAVQNPPHSVCCEIVRRALEGVAGRGYHVRDQKPLALDDVSLPEPDLVVVKGTVLDYADRHPEMAELIVEVADTTVAKDRGAKLRAYARNRIPAYWVINLPDGQIEVHQQPRGEGYQDRRVYKPGETLEVVIGERHAELPVAELIP